MGFTLVRSGSGFAAFTDAWRVPRSEVWRLRDAGELLSAAGEQAGAAEALAAAAEAEAHRKGYEAGLQEGRAAGAAEAARAVAGLVGEVRRVQAELRESLGALSLDVVRRVAAEIGPQGTLEAVVEQAVREVLSDQPLVVHVPPDAAPGVAQRLWPLNAEIEVKPDPQLEPGDCVIVTPHGSAHAGLELQLATLERAFADVGGPR